MRPLLVLLAGAAIALAGEPAADPATSLLPAGTILAVRVAPADRLDAVGAESGLERPVGRRLGDAVLDALGARLHVDRSRPFYVALAPGGPVTLLPAAPGTTAEQVRALGARFRLVGEGFIRISDAAEGETRATPLRLLAGDVSLAVPVAELLEPHRARMKEVLERIDGLEAAAREQRLPVPPAAIRLAQLLARRVVEAVGDVTEVHYALSWREGKLESEGWVRTRDDSPLRRWLERRTGGKPSDLIGLLPSRSFWMVESGGIAAGLDGDVAAMLDGAFGDGAGTALLLLLSPSYALHENLTGQAAGVIVIHGLMAAGMQSIHEVKPGAPIAEAIAALDAGKVNRRLADLGLPVEVRLERDHAKSGDTAIHRLTYLCRDPQVAMFLSQMQTCFAVEGSYLLVAQSGLPENELRALILRIRSGERAPHPHAKAMERLMPDRQEGLSINLGALKPVLGLAAMALPEAGKVVNAIPDDLWLSTALAVRGGHIHVRGDWPLKECLAFAAELEGMDLGGIGGGTRPPPPRPR